MNRILAILTAVAFVAMAETAPQKPRNAVDVLKAIREQNAKLLERQAASLKKLEELESTAKTVKNFAARS